MMSNTAADIERQSFAIRLQMALKKMNLPIKPASFRREFNLRTDGPGVSSHAVRKWLNGTAIPTQDKVHLIARWTGVSAQWLRFGDVDGAPGNHFDFEPRDFRLINDMRLLSTRDRNVVEQMIEALLRADSHA